MRYTVTVPASISTDGKDHCDPAMTYELSDWSVSNLREHGIIVTPV